jgi:hypothetical protein
MGKMMVNHNYEEFSYAETKTHLLNDNIGAANVVVRV